MPKLMPRHEERLASALREVDVCLGEAIAVLDPVSLHSPLSKRVDDVTEAEARLAADYADAVREAMRAIVERHGLRAQPSESALAAARAALDRAVVSVEELAPRHMRAFGPVSDDLEGELDRIVSRLLDGLDAMRGCLAPRPPIPGPPRIADPGKHSTDLHLLDALRRAIHDHEIASLRAPLEGLTERCASDDAEVAVFGRVNSGKSSLVNELLGQPLLPVGMTPVTAVPVYVSYGKGAWGYASFADAIPEKFALGRLPEFAAEHFNPANRRHVTRLRVESPAARQGVTLVDMPGTTFVPRGEELLSRPTAIRCDIGLVLIDAAAGLTLEEAVIVDALHRAGSHPLVLLTKADLLRREERWRIHAHVARGLSVMTGREVPVYFASTVAGDAALRRDWIERGLEALLLRRDELRARSLGAKLETLCDATIAALERRLALAHASPPPASEWTLAEARLKRAQSLIDEARAQRIDPLTEAETQSSALIDEVAHNAAVLWPQSHTASLDLTTLISESLQARANGGSRDAAREVRRLTAECTLALAAAAAAAGVARAVASALPCSADPPRFIGGCLGTTVLPRPVLAFLGRWRRSAGARRWLARPVLRAILAEALASHFARVEQWRIAAVDELRASFEKSSAALRARPEEVARMPSRAASAVARSIEASLTGLRRTRTQREHDSEGAAA
ncbi:MAG TPA: dynamin family protein [Casimicrobiaceae bacterium]|nr:dynamin family protein [Casimicrobiaceae bacterium]